MSIELTEQSQIPAAPFYVTMRDTFLSDWGQADARDARFIAPCDSRDEAERVAAYARSRSDQDQIEIVREPPMIHREARFGLMTRDDSANWYRGGVPTGEAA